MSKRNFDIWVCPDGDDLASGKADAPFATLARARDAVRELISGGVKRDIRVGIAGGVYRLTETVVFGLEDSAQEGCTVTYEALPGEQPGFTAGAPVSGWRKLDGLPPGAPEPARGNLWVADLPPGMSRFNTLYDADGLLPRATEPGFFPEKERVAKDNTTLYFPEGAMQDDPAIADGDVEIRIVPEWPWVMNILPLASVDLANRTAHTTLPATYRMTWSGSHVQFQVMGISAVTVENTFAGLREPGNWVVRSKERKIYLWPRQEGEPRGIKAPCLTELIRVEGQVEDPTVGRVRDPSGGNGSMEPSYIVADSPVRGLRFLGLTFTQADRFSWEPGRTGYTLQHEWEMFDRPTALVRLRGTEDCVFERCNFVQSSGTGLRMDLHAQRNRVEHCEFSHLGGCGVLLAGYGPGTKDVNHHNKVSHNHVHHIGALLWHSVGIFAWQSGHNRIERNLVHNTSYSAILVTGRIPWARDGLAECSRTIRWHEIDGNIDKDPALADKRRDLDSAPAPSWEAREKYLHGRGCVVARNEIHHCMEKLGDGNAIYISGTGRGVRVERNYIHDIMAPKINAVIRCDDDQHDVTIEGNLIVNCCAEGFIWKGRTTLRNNIVISLRGSRPDGGFCTSKRGHWVIPYCNEPDGEVGSVVEQNLFLCHDPEMKLLSDGGNMGRFYAGFFKRCNARNNLYWNTARPDWGLEHLRAQQAEGSEQGSVVADPQLTFGQGCVTFGPGSPALALGILPLDGAGVGL